MRVVRWSGLVAAAVAHLLGAALVLAPLAMAVPFRWAEALSVARWVAIVAAVVAATIVLVHHAGRPLAIVTLLVALGAGFWPGPARSTVVAGEIPVAGGVFSHAAFDAVLRRFVDARGLVDYPALVGDRAGLDLYVSQLAAASPTSRPDLFPTRDHALAYWINAYNALMLRTVAEHYPIESPRDILPAFGVYKRLWHAVGGEQLTLDDIEHRRIREGFGDPRIHFAVNCAAIACPRLTTEVFDPARLDAQLDAASRRFFATRFGLILKDGEAWVTPLLDWYGGDFGSDVRGAVRRFVPAEQQEAFDRAKELRFLDYDWRLNDQAAPWANETP